MADSPGRKDQASGSGSKRKAAHVPAVAGAPGHHHSTKKAKLEEDTPECAQPCPICFDCLDDQSGVVTLPAFVDASGHPVCGHVFHRECLRKLFDTPRHTTAGYTCPVCKVPIVVPYRTISSITTTRHIKEREELDQEVWKHLFLIKSNARFGKQNQETLQAIWSGQITQREYDRHLCFYGQFVVNNQGTPRMKTLLDQLKSVNRARPRLHATLGRILEGKPTVET